MSNKTYVIRQIAYHFNDEFYYVHSSGAIHDVFYDENEAVQAYHKLEINALRTCQLASFYAVAGYPEENKDVPEQLHAFMQTIPGGSIFKRSERKKSYGQLYVAQWDYRIPSEVNDDQVRKIQEITGIRFYELNVFENEPIYYQIWLPRSKNYYAVPSFTTYDINLSPVEHYERTNYFFDTHESALAYIRQAIKRADQYRLEGSFDELSHNPILLRSFVETHEHIVYKEDIKILEIDSKTSSATIIGLNSLLKEPLFEIHEVSLQDVRDYPHQPYKTQ